MSQSYKGWPLDKLIKERSKIDKAIKLAEKRDKKATLDKVAALARKNGFELHELLDGQAVRRGSKSTGTTAKVFKPRGKAPIKYRNPESSEQTWTGRGRQPLWVKDLLSAGATLEELKVANSAVV